MPKGFRSKAERRVYKLLRQALPHTAIETEYFIKTEGMEGQRLFFDLYLPTLQIAIEIQGDQHYEENYFFHGQEQVGEINFSNQKTRDRIKRELMEYGLGLVVLDYDDAMKITSEDLIKLIKKEVARRDTEI